MKPERWFYLDGLDANEFSPLWRILDRFWVEMNPPRNWCRVHYEQGDDLPVIQVPDGNFFPPALDRVSALIG